MRPWEGAIAWEGGHFGKRVFGEIASTPGLKDHVKELSARTKSDMIRIEEGR